MAGVRDMVTGARAVIEDLAPADVAAELAEGVIAGAVLVPRGMLEFQADGDAAEHRDGFDPDRRVTVYCASGSRSALAARSLQDLGYRDVANLHGGLTAWIAEGRPTTGPPPGR